jgi:RNA polymerase sigma-70 factor, ECF subfamily
VLIPAASARSQPQPLALADDSVVLAALRRGDECAFAALVDAYSPAMLRLASTFVPSRAVAEEVVQETWLGVLAGVDRFEGRSCLKTWIYQILINTGKTRGARERRSAPISALAPQSANGHDVDADRFFSSETGRLPGQWAQAPAPWPEQAVLASETRDVVARAIEALQPAQRAVISLRDVEGWSAEETCSALGLSEGNQRVLLHRARTHVRMAIETYVAPVEAATA